MKGLGERIQAARHAAGLSQERLAPLCGVSGSAVVSNWEIERSEPSYDTLVKLAEVLQVPVSYFFGCENGDDRITPEEYTIVFNFRKLDIKEKQAVSAVLTPEEYDIISHYRKLDREGTQAVSAILRVMTKTL